MQRPRKIPFGPMVLLLVIAVPVLFSLPYLGLLFGREAGEVGPTRLAETRAGIERMVERAEAGEADTAEEAFWEVHAFFHDVDPPLRARNERLAAELWELVAAVEAELDGPRQPGELARLGRRILDLLPRVARALGFEDA